VHLIKILENLGRVLQPLEINQIINSLPKELVVDKEKLIRFLLLTAFLDQQAESPPARSTAIKIHQIFGDDLFSKPQECLLQINKLVTIKDEYKISPAIGRVLPRFSWFVLSVGGFLTYEMMLNRSKLSEKFAECKTPKEAIMLLTYDSDEETMPMVYVSERTRKLLEKIVETLRKNTNTPARIVKSDAIHAAVEEYAKKLGVKE
jgi:hypothetical protein